MIYDNSDGKIFINWVLIQNSRFIIVNKAHVSVKQRITNMIKVDLT